MFASAENGIQTATIAHPVSLRTPSGSYRCVVQPVQIGVSPFAASRDGALRLARLAAHAGLDGLILGDGFVSTPSFPIWSGGLDCFVELGWLAGHVRVPSYGVDAVVIGNENARHWNSRS